MVSVSNYKWPSAISNFNILADINLEQYHFNFQILQIQFTIVVSKNNLLKCIVLNISFNRVCKHSSRFNHYEQIKFTWIRIKNMIHIRNNKDSILAYLLLFSWLEKSPNQNRRNTFIEYELNFSNTRQYQWTTNCWTNINMMTMMFWVNQN